MKKVLTLFFALVMVLSLAACGGNSSSRGQDDSGEDNTNSLDVSNAIAETPKHIYEDAQENLAKVMQNTYIMNCKVEKISGDYFDSRGLQIYLPVEELAKLNKDEKIAIIGRVTGESSNGLKVGEAEIYDGDVPEVAPRENEIYSHRKVDNIVKELNRITIHSDDSKTHIVVFAKDEDISSLEIYGGVTFSCDEVKEGDINVLYKDAKLISAD